jgi:hypothetical protein
VNRRDLIKTALGVPLLLALAESRAGEAARFRSRVRPSDPAWPNSARWDTLKQNVGGNLIKVQPLFAACRTEPKGTECVEALANARNPFYLGDQPAARRSPAGWMPGHFNEAWQHAFWGNNYRKLLAVKTKYDPDGLFFVHHGVGSEVWSADGFTRLV